MQTHVRPEPEMDLNFWLKYNFGAFLAKNVTSLHCVCTVQTLELTMFLWLNRFNFSFPDWVDRRVCTRDSNLVATQAWLLFRSR